MNYLSRRRGSRKARIDKMQIITRAQAPFRSGLMHVKIRALHDSRIFVSE